MTPRTHVSGTSERPRDMIPPHTRPGDVQTSPGHDAAANVPGTFPPVLLPTYTRKDQIMWTALRELFANLTPQGRFWLSVVIIAALLAVFVTMTVTGVDLTPLWALLGG